MMAAFYQTHNLIHLLLVNLDLEQNLDWTSSWIKLWIWLFSGQKYDLIGPVTEKEHANFDEHGPKNVEPKQEKNVWQQFHINVLQL